MSAADRIPTWDANDPGSLEAWFGPFSHAEHFRKVVLASARELERAKATAAKLRDNDYKLPSETRLDDLARVSDRYVQYLIDTLKGRELREQNVLSSMAGR